MFTKMWTLGRDSLWRYLPPETDRFLQAPSPSLVAARDTDARGLLRPPVCPSHQLHGNKSSLLHKPHYTSSLRYTVDDGGTFLP